MSIPNLLPAMALESDVMRTLRLEVRAWLQAEVDAGLFEPGVDRWLDGYDREFTTRLASRGWLGMTIPTKYGGQGKSFLERFVVTEELLAAGAPVAAAWIADRQVAPSLLRFGTEAQKNTYLPAISAGECFFSIGMSEPDSGSDLASVRTVATKSDDGWRLTGTKVWTSGAHLSDAFIVLARSSPKDMSRRHDGLSQFIVNLRAPGVEVRPIISLSGGHHFNEVHLDDVLVSHDMLLGTEGAGWEQVTSELAYERSGPERFLSTFQLLCAMVDEVRTNNPSAELGLGRIVGRLRALHCMSMAIAGALERGEYPDTAASIVKVLGTTFEGDIAEVVALGLHLDQDSVGNLGGRLDDLLATSLAHRPGFTIRGGTNEVLGGLIAKGLGLR
ncbi:acyl-CoA dehydrogenase family protein [Aeromicrobium alkaliterrae]|uniref:acyl-CoA dehydrogenase family protein n=1 Tax=Aeromicrobium alkaliterrae TaxID=302168 RepID=UPI0031D08E0A